MTCCLVLLLESLQPEFKKLPSSSPRHPVWMTTEGEAGGQAVQPLEQNALRFLNLCLTLDQLLGPTLSPPFVHLEDNSFLNS